MEAYTELDDYVENNLLAWYTDKSDTYFGETVKKRG